jgi:hypothetical protein
MLWSHAWWDVGFCPASDPFRLPDISIRVGFAVAHMSSNWACMLISSVFPPFAAAAVILVCTFVAAEGYIERTQIINTKNI